MAAIFGGSNFNIVGPTGALSGIIAAYVITNGLIGLPVLTVLVGLFIVISYLLKLERYLILIPSGVIHGFTLGVAFIIGLGQLNFALGLQNLTKHENFFDNTIESVKHFSNMSWVSFGIFAVSLIILLVFKKFVKKVPGAIVLAPIGILLGYFSEKNFSYLNIETLGAKFGEINFHLFEKTQLVFSVSMIETAAIIALIAILETMLSAKIADGMTKTKHNGRKEMLGLGLANIVSGLVGGMPATAALARTSLNIKTGATHRTSAIISVISIAIISLFLLGYFKYIPMAVIAAILVFTAIAMVETENYGKLWRYEKDGFFVSLLVALVTIVIDPIFGILIGVSISLLVFVDRISQGHFKLRINSLDKGIIDIDSGIRLKEIKESADVLLYSFSGKLCYINARAHLLRFETNLVKYKTIILRLREVNFMDTDGVETLDEIIDIIESRGQQVLLSGINKVNQALLEELSKGYKRLNERGLVFKKSQDAIIFLGIPLGKKE